MKYTLGRRYAPDSRDKAYKLAAITKPGGCLSFLHHVKETLWEPGSVLDQGATSECVAYAWTGWLAASPIRSVLNTPTDQDAIYHAAQLVDEWPGEDYDGTSVRAGAKVVQQLGHVSAYHWAEGVDDVVQFLKTTGPVVVGTNWYEGMFEPKAGYLEPTGGIAGGHAWLLLGWSPIKNALRMINSWGAGWGENGQAWVAKDVFGQLLSEQGEACAAVQQVLPA